HPHVSPLLPADLSMAKRKFAESLNEFKFQCIGDAETDDEICIGELHQVHPHTHTPTPTHTHTHTHKHNHHPHILTPHKSACVCDIMEKLSSEKEQRTWPAGWRKRCGGCWGGGGGGGGGVFLFLCVCMFFLPSLYSYRGGSLCSL